MAHKVVYTPQDSYRRCRISDACRRVQRFDDKYCRYIFNTGSMFCNVSMDSNAPAGDLRAFRQAIFIIFNFDRCIKIFL